MKLLAYLKARLSERSTWASIAVGIPAAAVLPWPWSVVMAAVSVIGVLTPEPTKAG